MVLRRTLLSTTAMSGFIGVAVLTDTTALAADLYTKAAPVSAIAGPAVDGVNWKFDGLAGSFADRNIYGGRGAVTVPLGSQLGLQVDGGLGNFDSRFFGSVAGHLFQRDPSRGLFGLYVNHTHWSQFSGLHVTQVAGEGEAYLGRWTLQGIAGVETGNSATHVTTVINSPFITSYTTTVDIRTRFFDQINLAYYFTDNLKGFVGHRYLGGKNALAIGAEYGIPVGGGKLAALFVEGRVGDHESRGVWGGVRFYFGQKDKPLMQRHRQDDPLMDWMPASLLSITSQFKNTSRTWCLNGELVQNGCV
jgi:hypothetical protein